MIAARRCAHVSEVCILVCSRCMLTVIGVRRCMYVPLGALMNKAYDDCWVLGGNAIVPFGAPMDKAYADSGRRCIYVPLGALMDKAHAYCDLCEAMQECASRCAHG